MEMNTQRRGAGLKEKIPDIKKTLDTVKLLKMRRKVCQSLPADVVSGMQVLTVGAGRHGYVFGNAL